jgi:hypothetical protein
LAPVLKVGGESISLKCHYPQRKHLLVARSTQLYFWFKNKLEPKHMRIYNSPDFFGIREVGFIERKAIHQYFGQLAYKPTPRFIPYVLQMELETQIRILREPK